jgi:hypothetical protein
MRFEIRTPLRAISTLVVLFVLVFGASMDTLAQGNSRWGRSHNRGRHLGWERGRRNNDRRLFRRSMRRERRQDRRERRQDRRELRRERRSSYGNDRSVLQSRFRQERADLRLRQRSDRDSFRQSRGHGRH